MVKADTSTQGEPSRPKVMPIWLGLGEAMKGERTDVSTLVTPVGN